MTLGWHLTFLRQGQVCVSMHLYWDNIEKNKSFSLCINDQCLKIIIMIKVAKPFGYNQKFVTKGYLPLPRGYINV